MGGFSNYLVTKTGNLVRTFIQSPNFVHLVSGWSIFKDGSAEFSDILIRGGVIEGAPGLYYDGEPMFGNLVASVSGTSGVDIYGNAYLRGLAVYGSGVLALVMFNSLLTYWNAAGPAGPWAPGTALLSLVSGTAEINATSTLITGGPLNAVAGTAAAPSAITTDTWHSLGSAGSTGMTLEQARYTLTPELEVMLDFAFVVGSAGSTPGTYTWSNTLPASPNYQPAGNYLRICELAYNAAPAGAQNAIVAVDGDGTANPGRVRITIPALAANVCVSGTFRLPLT